MLSLGDERLVAEIAAGLVEGGIDPAHLTFEITKTTAAEDLDRAVRFACRLEELGCGVSFDDFGTGFGSFTYLDRLLASELKIDRGFVEGLHRSEAKRRIAQTIVAIAENFGLRPSPRGSRTRTPGSCSASGGSTSARATCSGCRSWSERTGVRERWMQPRPG